MSLSGLALLTSIPWSSPLIVSSRSSVVLVTLLLLLRQDLPLWSFLDSLGCPFFFLLRFITSLVTVRKCLCRRTDYIYFDIFFKFDFGCRVLSQLRSCAVVDICFRKDQTIHDLNFFSSWLKFVQFLCIASKRFSSCIVPSFLGNLLCVVSFFYVSILHYVSKVVSHNSKKTCDFKSIEIIDQVWRLVTIPYRRPEIALVFRSLIDWVFFNSYLWRLGTSQKESVMSSYDVSTSTSRFRSRLINVDRLRCIQDACVSIKMSLVEWRMIFFDVKTLNQTLNRKLWQEHFIISRVQRFTWLLWAGKNAVFQYRNVDSALELRKLIEFRLISWFLRVSEMNDEIFFEMGKRYLYFSCNR